MGMIYVDCRSVNLTFRVHQHLRMQYQQGDHLCRTKFGLVSLYWKLISVLRSHRFTFTSKAVRIWNSFHEYDNMSRVVVVWEPLFITRGHYIMCGQRIVRSANTSSTVPSERSHDAPIYGTFLGNINSFYRAEAQSGLFLLVGDPPRQIFLPLILHDQFRKRRGMDKGKEQAKLRLRLKVSISTSADTFTFLWSTNWRRCFFLFLKKELLDKWGLQLNFVNYFKNRLN